jgi:hypothetical protein
MLFNLLNIYGNLVTKYQFLQNPCKEVLRGSFLLGQWVN